jgi:tricorn protease
MKKIFLVLNLLMVTFLSTVSTYGIDTKDTRMLSQPAISATRIAFIYAEDLWTANVDGSEPRRLTVDYGIEADPCFSPDGSMICFSAQYDGNTDIFIIPASGGIPKRLTWHPGADFARGFTPDGKNVVFVSQRSSFSGRYYQLFTVGTEGGFPVKLDIPNAWTASYSPDGRFMAYNPLTPPYHQWKNYRGGTISVIWLYSFDDHSIKKIPQPQGGCNDAEPRWVGDKIYFISDRDGEFNLYSYDRLTGSTGKLTDFTDFPIESTSACQGKLAFEQAGYLHLFDPSSSTHKKLTIGIAADLLELRPRYVSGSRYVRTLDISPSGSRIVVDFRGDIVTVPAEKGDPRNITLSVAAHERFPSWSPDGKSVAYFSDASGEYTLHIRPQDGKGDPRSIVLSGTGFYAFPEWSPDGKMIAFTDNGRNLYITDLQSGSIRKIDSDELYTPGSFRDMSCDWASDSKWLLYTKITRTNFKVIYLYSLDQQKSFQVTDGMSDASDPVFDPNGENIYFFASTDAGPVLNWFDLSSYDKKMTRSIYLATLRKDIISPFVKESDEEVAKKEEEAKKPETDSDKKARNAKTVQPEPEKPKLLKIEPEGITDRIITFPVSSGDYYNLMVGSSGEVFYLVRPSNPSSSSTLRKYSIKERKDSEVMEADGCKISGDRKKMVYIKGGTYGITETGKKPEPGKGILNISAISVRIDPAAEWPQIFDEAWRINRDYFYDPGMHGADWKAMKVKYAKLLPDAACRSDINKIIQWMCSEIAVGHHRVGGGERLSEPRQVNGGLLGADYVIANNRYRIGKIYGGLNWNPDLRSPLTEPGLNVSTGDYILAVNGNELTADKNIYSLFENTSGKITELTINSKPDFAGSRIIKVVPIGGEYSLRNRDWVEGNLKRVTEATNGQVAYVYVPNTSAAGYEYFRRYFFPQVNRKAIIVDERFNGGGSLADYYIDMLQRPVQAYWNTRYGNNLKTPTASIQGPKVMIIDETAGSGGDMLPWMFRKYNVGTLVGKRTWGGLVGILGFPELIDGGQVTAPNLAIWTKDGFIVENVGIEPDIEVEQMPADIINGKDPQLEKAIEVAMGELAKNPMSEPVPPPYPVRVRRDVYQAGTVAADKK